MADPVPLQGHPPGCNAGSPGGMCCGWCPPDTAPASPPPSPPETPRSPAPRDAADDYADPAPHSDSCVGRIHDSLGCSCRPDPAALAPRDGDPRFAAICRALRGDAPDIDEAYRIAQEATTGAAPAPTPSKEDPTP